MPDDKPVESDRAEIRGILATNIRTLNARVEAAQAEELSTAEEELQLKRLRTISQLSRQFRLLARDADVDEMEADIDALRAAVEGDE